MARLKRISKSTLQNIAIFLLSVSACLLLTQTQLSTVWMNAGQMALSQLMGKNNAPAAVTQIATTADIPISVQVVVTGTYGRYGSPNLISTDKAFTTFRTLLSEALGSAGEPKPCEESAFRRALNETSLYFDFGEDFPLPILAGLMGTDMPDYDCTSRRLAMTTGPSGVMLWMLNEAGNAKKSDTAIPSATLRELTDAYQLGNVSFAFEMQDDARLLSPYSLLLTEPPKTVALKASNALDDQDDLLSQLQFNPHTNSRYTETGGTEVIVEGDSTLRIEPDGTILLQNGNNIDLKFTAPTDTMTVTEPVVQTYQWLSALMRGKLGDGILVLKQTEQEDAEETEHTVYHLQFSCLVDGVPVHFSDGDDVAEVTIEDQKIKTCKIHFRKYEKTEISSLLLPLPQAIAIARQYPGRDLMEYYIDDGSAEIDVFWLMR